MGKPLKTLQLDSQKMKLTRYSNSFYFGISDRCVVDTPDRNSLKESPNFLGSFYESYPSTSTIQSTTYDAVMMPYDAVCNVL